MAESMEKAEADKTIEEEYDELEDTEDAEMQSDSSESDVDNDEEDEEANKKRLEELQKQVPLLFVVVFFSFSIDLTM